jgi:ATP-binding cassette, subfamily B (MDR/TAP), member 1
MGDVPLLTGSRQIRELQMATSQPLGFFIEDTAAALAAIGIAFYYSWNLTLVILAFVPITIVILAVITRKLPPAIESQKRDLDEASNYSHTAITAVETVKIFNGQDQEVWQYARAVKRAAKSYMIQAHANSLQMGITRFMTTGMFVVGFWYGIALVRQGLSPGNVLTTFYSCLMATEAAEALLPQWLVLSKGMSAGETLRHMLLQMDRGRRVSRMMGTLKPATCSGDVEVSNVCLLINSTSGSY